MRGVSVLGIGETKMGKLPIRSLRGLILDAGTKAIADAGIETDRIHALSMGNFNSSHFCQQSLIGSIGEHCLNRLRLPSVRRGKLHHQCRYRGQRRRKSVNWVWIDY